MHRAQLQLYTTRNNNQIFSMLLTATTYYIRFNMKLNQTKA